MVAGILVVPLYSQELWEVTSYSDEMGFQKRMAPMLQRIASRGFGQRSQARSRCPDTGLPVKTWAVEGETIFSPYTGRAYRQGPTGYFGPKARNGKGEIIAFGGDPLKYDLRPATATLLLDPQHAQARAFLTIPGNLRQQYHFACKNWARFYPLLAEEMGEEWKSKFWNWVGRYRESRLPSDGPKKWRELTRPHDLVGEGGQLLGGNSIDGGTENHKTMWRTSGLVYAQLFPDTASISGYSPQVAKERIKSLLRDYLQKLLFTGNGEYDSEIYYPHTIEGFLNLYDFSTDPEIKTLAKFALDYYFTTYGLKVIDGAIAGGQKRGYLPGEEPGEMETMLWAFFDDTARDMTTAVASLQQVTTTYRPNALIENIVRGKVALPFEAKMCRPFYHMDRYNAFQESFYRSTNFGLGNVYMSIVDNPNQQMVWSLVTTGQSGPLAITGGQPYAQTATGHSPYTQTAHSKGTLLLLTAPTEIDTTADQEFVIYPKRMNPWHLPDSAQVAAFEQANRQRYASEPLQEFQAPVALNAASLTKLWKDKTHMAASWLWVPKEAEERMWKDGRLFLRLHRTLVAITPINEEYFEVDVTASELDGLKIKSFRKMLETHSLLIFSGQISGYVLEAVEHSDYSSFDEFTAAIEEKTQLDTSRLQVALEVNYQSLNGEEIQMQYRPKHLKAAVQVDGRKLDYDHWIDGATYESPYLKIKKGLMEVTDGKSAYQVDFRGDNPIYK